MSTPPAADVAGIPPRGPQPDVLPCAHFDAHECRSCTLLLMPTEDRLTRVQADVAALLHPFAAVHADAEVDTEAGSPWQAPVRSPLAGFRNKAKMVVSGTVDAPVLGILDEAGEAVDLSDCPLYPAPVHAVLAALPALIRRAQVPPYSVTKRKGQLKHVLVTASGAGELMVRFVLREPSPVERIREHLSLLTDAVAGVRVVTANLQPDHAAVLEGPEEIHIWGDETLTVQQGRIPLRVRPQSFLQTNTVVAAQLYEQVAAWVDEAEASSGLRSPYVVWDLFCGVGGFALHCAQPRNEGTARRRVIGVEVSEQAIESARTTAAQLGLDAEFHAADAAVFASAADGAASPTLDGALTLPGGEDSSEESAGGSAEAPLPRPDLLIVNPPRRGLGTELADWVEHSEIPDVVYSSCNPRTLARDLETMRSYRITAARLLDMFPHTAHSEVVVRLVRAGR